MPDKPPTLTVGDKTYDFPVMSGTDRARCHRHPQALRPDRACSPTTRASPRPRAASPRSPTSTATRASCSIAATRSSSWPNTATSSRSATCCCTASCRPRRRRPISTTASRATPWCTSRWRASSRASAATRIRWRSWWRRSARCRRSITTPPTSPIRTQRMIASIRMIAKMPTIAAMAYKYFDRPALRVSEERPRLRRELPAHVLRGAVRGVQGQSGAGARAGPDLHPARRPRAERLDLDGAPGRLVGRQPVRLHRRRHRLPVGPGAWRRQRGGAEDARGDRHGRPHSRIHRARPRTRTIRSA